MSLALYCYWITISQNYIISNIHFMCKLITKLWIKVHYEVKTCFWLKFLCMTQKYSTNSRNIFLKSELKFGQQFVPMFLQVSAKTVLFLLSFNSKLKPAGKNKANHVCVYPGQSKVLGPVGPCFILQYPSNYFNYQNFQNHISN